MYPFAVSSTTCHKYDTRTPPPHSDTSFRVSLVSTGKFSSTVHRRSCVWSTDAILPGHLYFPLCFSVFVLSSPLQSLAQHSFFDTRLRLFDQCEVASLVSHLPWLSHHLSLLGANMLTSEEDDIFVTLTRAAKPTAPAASLDEAGRSTKGFFLIRCGNACLVQMCGRLTGCALAWNVPHDPHEVFGCCTPPPSPVLLTLPQKVDRFQSTLLLYKRALNVLSLLTVYQVELLEYYRQTRDPMVLEDVPIFTDLCHRVHHCVVQASRKHWAPWCYTSA